MARLLPAAEPLRYTLAVAIGLGADLALAWTLRTFGGLPALLCGAAGFLLGVVINYVNFEMWVFAPGPLGIRRLSWQGLARVMVAAQGAFAVRLGAVAVLSLLGLPSLIVFGGGAGLSFLVNFVLSRRAIRSSPHRER